MVAALLLTLVAAEPSLPQELVTAAERLQQVHSLEARVYQEKRIAALTDVARDNGTFAFERPRRLAMDLGGPAGTRLVIDGDTMALTYKALGRTERIELSQDPRARAVADQLFILLEADVAALARVYSAAVLGKSPLRVRLTPLSETLGRIIAHVDATIAARGFVSAIDIVEANGDRTLWRFDEPVLNKPIPAERFALPSP
jgi:outer membrane lipoprotein-sorting protein